MLTLERPTKIPASDTDRATARRLAQAIQSAPTLGEVESELADAPIPEYIRAILTSVLERAGTEDTFYFLQENKELSPNIAARIIGCSRPFVIHLIESQKLPAHKVGSHYRIRVNDIKNYIEARERRYQQVAELVKDRESMGL